MRIGLLMGREKTFPQSLTELVRKRDGHITLEMILLGGNRYDDDIPFALIIDRISHLVPYYRSYLKTAKLSGVYLINNPYTNGTIDIFTQSLLASRVGARTPKLVSYTTDLPAGNILERNLCYPTPWKQHIDYLGGFPIILRSIHSTDWVRPRVISSMEQFLAFQKEGWTAAIALQELLDYEIYLRCFCVGKSVARLCQNHPETHQYVEHHLPAGLAAEIIGHSQQLADVFEYDLCSFDWGIWRGQAFLIDLVSPIPDLSAATLNNDVQDWVFNRFADLCVDILHRASKG